MEKITIKVPEFSTWAASSDLTPIKLPREGLITEVKIRFACTTAALTKTVTLENYRRTIQNLKIQGDGGHAYLGLSGPQMGRLLALLNEYEYGSAFLTPPVNIAATVAHRSWVFHPGSNPLDPFDMSVVIPAKALATLQVLLTTSANTLVDAAAAIASGYFYYEVNEVLEVNVPAGIMTPQGSTMPWPHDSDHSDFSHNIDVPGGAWLRRIIMMVQDDSAVPDLADDEVAGVKLKLPRTASAQIETFWEELKVESARFNRFPGRPNPVLVTTAEQYPPGLMEMVLPKGFAILDLRKYFHPIWGANLTNFQTGDVKLGLTIENYAAGDDTIIYWDQLAPVDSKYVGK